MKGENIFRRLQPRPIQIQNNFGHITHLKTGRINQYQIKLLIKESLLLILQGQKLLIFFPICI